MNLNNLDLYKINENSVLSDIDRKHIENYKQLIKFFENAINQSINEGKTNYNSLHNSCIQSIRYLDSLILTYESSVQGVRLLNNTINKIVEDSKDSQDEGNDQE
jgi:hypothetical protein